MINELYSVYQGLKDVGEEPEIKHNDIAAPGMGTTFRVCLAENGTVDSVELLTKEKIKDTWSLGDGNKNQFPASKLEMPLIPDGHNEYRKWKENNRNPEVEKYREFIQSQISKNPIDLPARWPSYRKRILERSDSLKEILGHNSDVRLVYELFERYKKVANDGCALLSQIIEKFRVLLSSATKEEIKAIASVLFADSITVKGKVEDVCKVTLLIDCLPQKDIDVYASSRSRVPVLSDALFASEQGNDKKKGVCAMSGKETELSQNKFPSQKLSVIGPTIILAKSETSGPTVKRYDKSGTDSFSLGKLMGDKLAASMAFLTTDDLKDKTWKSIPSSGASLLLAYCKSKYDLAITPVITGVNIDDFEDYENATETVLGLFNKSDCTPDDAVEICEIRKINDGNRQVNYSTTSSIGKISAAANNWIKACKNVPDFKLLAKIKNENKTLGPWAIAPIESCELSRNKFKQNGNDIDILMLNKNGRKVKPHPTISFADTMILFMTQTDRVRQLALRTIEKFANQVEPLFEYCVC